MVKMKGKLLTIIPTIIIPISIIISCSENYRNTEEFRQELLSLYPNTIKTERDKPIEQVKERFQNMTKEEQIDFGGSVLGIPPIPKKFDFLKMYFAVHTGNPNEIITGIEFMRDYEYSFVIKGKIVAKFINIVGFPD